MSTKLKIIAVGICLLGVSAGGAYAQQSTTGPVPPPGIDLGKVDKARTQFVIPEFPAYIWQHGCGPTAVGMVIGFWDMAGPDLIPGDASTQTDAVNNMMSGDHQFPNCGQPYSDHYQDYACPIDDYTPSMMTDRSELGGAHTDNCVADYMKTSQSASGNRYGWSWFDHIPASFLGYVNQVAPGLNPVVTNFEYWNFTFEDYKNEINNLRPVVLLVDTDADGITDHFPTAIGYDDINMEYGIYNTWDMSIHWFPWREIATGVPWGIYGITTFSGIDWSKPYFIADSSSFTDTDGDFFRDPGDTVEVVVYLKNYGLEATNLEISLVSSNPDVVFLNSSIVVPFVGGASTPYNNGAEPLSYIVPQTVNPRYDSFYVTVTTEDDSYSKTFPYEEIIGHCRILIVDDDRGSKYEEFYYFKDLHDIIVPSHIWDKESSGSPLSSLLSQYSTVIWFTGDTSSDLIQASDISAMKSYLDGGGNLFLSGQGLASELNDEDPAFLADYLHAGEGSSYFHFAHTGVAGSPIGDGFQIRYFSGANQEIAASRQITVLPPAQAAFNFKNGGPSALSFDGDYNLVFFNWGYEAIAESYSTYNTRDTVLKRILLFLSGWAEAPCFDSDGDSFGDPGHPENICAVDNCPNVYNPDQADSDADGIGNVCDFICGDANGNQAVNILDVTFLIAYLYKGGAAPSPPEAGDANGNGATNILDATYLLAYLYKGGPVPICP